MRLHLALLVVLAALGAAPAAHAAAGIEIEVDGQVKTLSAEQIVTGADVRDRTYTVDGTPQTITGVSLREALVVSGVDPATSSGVTVHGAGGTRLQILEPELADPPPFPEGPVVLWTEGDVTKLLLPVGGQQARASRVIASGRGEPLSLEPMASNVIAIGIATPGEGVTAKVGERLTFAAHGGGTGAGALEWRWDFGDGTTATGADVRHAFRAAGSYRVVLTAGGGTATVLVTVEDEKPEEQEREKANDGVGGGDGTGAGSGSTSDVAPTPSSSPAPAASPTPAPEPEPEREPEPKPKRKPDKPEPEPEPPATALETVEGVVLSSDAAAPVPAPTAQAAGLTPKESTGEDGEGPGVPWVSLAIVLAFLSGLQAARVQRSRWLPRRR